MKRLYLYLVPLIVIITAISTITLILHNKDGEMKASLSKAADKAKSSVLSGDEMNGMTTNQQAAFSQYSDLSKTFMSGLQTDIPVYLPSELNKDYIYFPEEDKEKSLFIKEQKSTKTGYSLLIGTDQSIPNFHSNVFSINGDINKPDGFIPAIMAQYKGMQNSDIELTKGITATHYIVDLNVDGGDFVCWNYGTWSIQVCANPNEASENNTVQIAREIAAILPAIKIPAIKGYISIYDGGIGRMYADMSWQTENGYYSLGVPDSVQLFIELACSINVQNEPVKEAVQENAVGTLVKPVGGMVNTPPYLIYMLNEQDGYGHTAEHPVMVTVDGCVTWMDVTPRTLEHPVVTIDGYATGMDMTPRIKENYTEAGIIIIPYFINAQTGWAFKLQPDKSVTVYGTQDGGQSWTVLAALPVKYGDGNMTVAFADAKHGWFEDRTAGNGTLTGELFYTNDGGKTWQRMADSTWQDSIPYGDGQITAQNSSTLWLSDRREILGSGIVWLYKSSDCGKTWEQIDIPLPASHMNDAIRVSTPQFFGNKIFITIQCYVLNEYYQEVEKVLYTSKDGGLTWSVCSTFNAGNVDDWPVFSDALHGWQISDKQIYYTENGGYTWQSIKADTILKELLNEYAIMQVDFIDDQKGWLLLTREGGPDRKLLVTNDGGQSWREIKK